MSLLVVFSSSIYFPAMDVFHKAPSCHQQDSQQKNLSAYAYKSLFHLLPYAGMATVLVHLPSYD